MSFGDSDHEPESESWSHHQYNLDLNGYSFDFSGSVYFYSNLHALFRDCESVENALNFTLNANPQIDGCGHAYDGHHGGHAAAFIRAHLDSHEYALLNNKYELNHNKTTYTK